MLIGGAGSDRLVGGGGDDILIGGATAFDANGAALCAIMDEWAHTGLSYRQRVDHLTGTPGGQNAPYYLNATTVSNDGAADTMTGSSGADLFFASLGDRVTGKKAGEVVVAV